MDRPRPHLPYTVNRHCPHPSRWAPSTPHTTVDRHCPHPFPSNHMWTGPVHISHTLWTGTVHTLPHKPNVDGPRPHHILPWTGTVHIHPHQIICRRALSTRGWAPSTPHTTVDRHCPHSSPSNHMWTGPVHISHTLSTSIPIKSYVDGPRPHLPYTVDRHCPHPSP